ncbi:hypothetical protein CANARDRAFT_16516, partial [[Candida] arabinofermentans NRRL YB-2248]
MSSINKSSTRFTPKLQQRNRNNILKPSTTQKHVQIVTPQVTNEDTTTNDNASDDDDPLSSKPIDQSSISTPNKQFNDFTKPNDVTVQRRESSVSLRRASITLKKPSISISLRKPSFSDTASTTNTNTTTTTTNTTVGPTQRRLSSLSQPGIVNTLPPNDVVRSRQSSFSIPTSRRNSSVSIMNDDESDNGSVSSTSAVKIGIPTIGPLKRKRRRTSSIVNKRTNLAKDDSSNVGETVVEEEHEVSTISIPTRIETPMIPLSIEQPKEQPTEQLKEQSTEQPTPTVKPSVQPTVQPTDYESVKKLEFDQDLKPTSDSRIDSILKDLEDDDSIDKDELNNAKTIYYTSLKIPNQETKLLHPLNQYFRLDGKYNLKFYKRQRKPTLINFKNAQDLINNAIDNYNSSSKDKSPIIHVTFIKFVINPINNRLMKLTIEEFNHVDNLVNEKGLISDIKLLNTVKSNEDPELLKNFIIDENKISMENLCKPLIQVGKISEETFHKSIEGDLKRKLKSKERSLKRKEARILRLPIDKIEKNKDDEFERERIRNINNLMNQPLNETTAKNTMQLQTDEQGNIVVNQESTVFDRHNNDLQKNDSRIRETENIFENPITSSSYSKRKFTEKWTNDETVEFYKALSDWGTDFTLISNLFPYRTRKEIKNKFLIEEKNNLHLVEMCLLKKQPIDIIEYSLKTGLTFKSLDEYNSEIKNLKIKHDKEIKEMKLLKEKARLEDLQKNNNDNNGNNGYKLSNSRSKRQNLIEFRKNEEVVGVVGNNK